MLYCELPRERRERFGKWLTTWDGSRWPDALVAAFAFACVLTAAWLYGSHTRPPLTSWRALFFDRSLNFAAGVSPLLPLTFLCGTYFFWAYYQLKRRHLIDEYAGLCPFPGPPPGAPPGRFDRVRSLDRQLAREAKNSFYFAYAHPVATAAAVLLVAAVVAARAGDLYLPVAEGPAWDRVFQLGFLVAYVLIAINLTRLLFLWSRVKKLLHAIALLPMAVSFRHLPDAVAANFGGYLYSRRPYSSHLWLPEHQLDLLARSTQELAEAFPPRTYQAADGGSGFDLAEARAAMEFAEMLRRRPGQQPREPDPDLTPGEIRTRFALRARRFLRVLARTWPDRSLDDAFGDEHPEQPPAEPASPRERWVRLAEGFVAVQVVLYLGQCFIRLRNLVWSVTVCASLLLLAGTSYPFHPERLMLGLLIALILAAVALTVTILVQLNRNELVSWITKTSPGKFTLDSGFVGSFFTYVLPVVGLLVIQLSGAFRFLFEPVLRVLK